MQRKLRNSLSITALALTITTTPNAIATTIETTGLTGLGQHYTNTQPSIALEQFILSYGSTFNDMPRLRTTIVPSNLLHDNAKTLNGQILPIAQNNALFSWLGTTYGGNGETTFALPDLSGRVGTQTNLGNKIGTLNTSISIDQMPEHNHTYAGGTTSNAGNGQPINNIQPSLGISYYVSTVGVFPTSFSEQKFVGQIAQFAADDDHTGWIKAEGQLLPIAQHTALFSLYGTSFGGNGETTFALPNFNNRTPIGIGNGPGLPNISIGQVLGQNQYTLNQIPEHNHTLPVGPETHTGNTGSNTSINNMQESIGINFLIALEGQNPEQAIGNETTLGEIVMFGGNFTPDGYAPANGQLLNINQHNELFSLIGTTYGGDGQTTFALPDLRGRTLIGQGTGTGLETWSLGQTDGERITDIQIENIPRHNHQYEIPEPSTLALLALSSIYFTKRKKQ